MAEIPIIAREKTDQKVEICTPAWLDDIIVITPKRSRKMFEVRRAGYRTSETSEFVQNNTN